jgi:predicted dehydrogenase
MINWGIIGCGNVTEVKSGPAFSKTDGSRLFGVTRRNLELAEDYARRHNVPKVFPDAGALINSDEIDAVYIATPPGSHMEHALEVIRAGKPIYIEKPMALNYAECERINEAADKHRVPVFVAYYRRALPGFLFVRDLLEKGSIGKVMAVKIELYKYASEDEKSGRLPWRVEPAFSGGGHFFDLACHQLDYLDFILGPVTDVRSLVLNQGGYYQAEDFVSASFLFPENVVCTGIWSFCVSKESSRDVIEITGSEGSIYFSTFSFEPIVLVNSSGRQVFTNERPEHVQGNLIKKIIGELNGTDKSPSTGVTAARTSLVMDKVVEEYYGKKITR